MESDMEKNAIEHAEKFISGPYEPGSAYLGRIGAFKAGDAHGFARAVEKLRSSEAAKKYADHPCAMTGNDWANWIMESDNG